MVMTLVASSVASSMVLQTQDAIGGHSTLLIVFIGIAALGMLLQSIILISVGLGALKVQQEVSGYIKELHGKAMPFIATSHQLVNDLTPEIKAITTKVHEISGTVGNITVKVEEITGLVKEKIEEFSPTIDKVNENVQAASATAKDVNEKTRAQVNRVNGMISATLDATEKLGKSIQYGISMPGREAASLMSAVKAGVESLKKNSNTFKFSSLFGSKPKFGSGVQPGKPYQSRVIPYPPARIGSASLGSAGEYDRTKVGDKGPSGL